MIFKKCTKHFIVSELTLSLLLVAIPGKETCYKMLVASQVTDENIEKVENVIKDSVDYIFEKLEK